MVRSEQHLPPQVRLVPIGLSDVEYLPNGRVLMITEEQHPSDGWIIPEHDLHGKACVVPVAHILIRTLFERAVNDNAEIAGLGGE